MYIPYPVSLGWRPTNRATWRAGRATRYTTNSCHALTPSSNSSRLAVALHPRRPWPRAPPCLVVAVVLGARNWAPLVPSLFSLSSEVPRSWLFYSHLCFWTLRSLLRPGSAPPPPLRNGDTRGDAVAPGRGNTWQLTRCPPIPAPLCRGSS